MNKKYYYVYYLLKENTVVISRILPATQSRECFQTVVPGMENTNLCTCFNV